MPLPLADEPESARTGQVSCHGADPIVVSFEEPVCAFGVEYAQGGAHNPHHPDLRRRTSFGFFDRTGARIATFDQKPGHFISRAAFTRGATDPYIWAVTIDSDVSFAVLEMVAMPRALPMG